MELDLGISKEELLVQVVSVAADKFLATVEGTELLSVVEKAVADRSREAVDEAVSRIAGRELGPLVDGKIEEMILQETNRWGEKVGEPKTFVEYLVARGEAWLQEPVDSRGKAKSEHRHASDFTARNAVPRIVFMIDGHLKYSIKTAMESALKEANSQIVDGIATAARDSLRSLSTTLKVTAEVKS